MKISITLIGCLSVMILSGCSTTWQYVKLPDQSKRISDPGRCRIYLIRSTTDGGRIETEVFDDKTLVGTTRPGGYLCWERIPGQATLLSSSTGDYRLPLTLDAGQVYFIIQHVGPGRFFAQTSLEVVPNEQGQAAMQGRKPPSLRTRAASRAPYSGQPGPVEFTPPQEATSSSPGR